jgi:two-component system, NtrC family, response regulator GlrR
MAGALSRREHVFPRPRILVLGAQASVSGAQIRDILLAAGGYTVALQRADTAPADLIIPILSPDQDPHTVLMELHARAPEAHLLPILDEQHLSQALGRLPPQITDFLASPIRGPELLARVRRLLPLDIKTETERAKVRLQESIGLDRLIGVDPALQAVKEQIRRVAKTDVTVLVTGETGTGKELTAQAIHYLSGRAAKALVPVNCGAIPPDLFENELFGHHRGAFTDARSYQPGLIAEAEEGTLFLDDINALPPTAQAKLLRFLEDRTYRPLGSPRSIQANVRVVAATNTDLREKARGGAFREDLFYRLQVVMVHLPPLRERVGDIAPLAEFFEERHKTGNGYWGFSAEALHAMREYEWPGNVRELENMVRQLVVMYPPKVIRAGDLPWPLRPSEHAPDESFRAAKTQAIARFERIYLSALLETHRGNITRAAQAARQDRSTFRRLIRKHRLDPSTWTGNGKRGGVNIPHHRGQPPPPTGP